MRAPKLLLSQLIQLRNPVTPEPPNHFRDCLQVVANGSDGVALVGQPLQEIIEKRSEDRQGSPPGKGPGTDLLEERFYFHSRRRNTFWPPVNNVELKAAAEPAGVEELPSAQHYWALNISHKMLSSTFCDELGYLPIDKNGADLLFQIISGRYEKGSTIITTNQIYKHWARIFNNDATITSAVLDRLLHHAETVIVEGKSYRTKDRIEEP
jgi:hypothetical protein